MKPEDFVHLHCHSTYSLLEALPSPEEIIVRAKELNQHAVGLTDRGHAYGLIEFYQYAQKHDVKPILGLEAFMAARTRNDKESGTDSRSSTIVLLAENQEGYANLLELATKGSIEGMYYRPRIDAELLKMHGKGLIILTSSISGQIPKAALEEDAEEIKKLTAFYRECVGEENVYFELIDLPNLAGQAEINQQLIHWGKELNVPLVVTGNSYYCRPEDAEAHDALLCIQKNANINDESRFSMRDNDYSMRPFEELEKAFAHAPEALENTRVIADRCKVDFEFGTNQIPRFPVPDGKSEEEHLTMLCEKGFEKRYNKAPEEYKERLNYELSIIKQVGFSGYFLIVADFVNEAKGRGITVGPGRGSAAGSMVSYCLGITGVDPMEHSLLFERFLNPERISMPDIDLDFADTRRDEILEYVREKYGRDHVVQICTFGTLAARAAVKDVGRVFGIPFMEMNTLAKLIPDKPGTTLTEALDTVELKSAYDSNEIYKKIIDTALKLEGKARHVSVHACGVIITPEPTVRYTAIQKAPKDENTIITQYSAKPLEALGLLKMDFLGLTNLTVIQTSLEIIRRTLGKEIDIENIPLDDEKAFGLLQRGDTTGVFQLESGGMRRYLKQLKPTEFGDITAMVSLYRPGPMEWIPSYIKRKHGKEKVKYVHDDLKPILEPTYGIGVYQEQILQIAQAFAGYTLGEADILRRAIGKKIKSELDAQREKFIKGALEKGYKQKLAEQIFDDVITPFAGYGFNKSHAVGYARIAYETAYLKANFPAQFMAALLSSDAQNTERIMIEIEECRTMGIEVLPPDINESLRNFTVVEPKEEGDAFSIRFGLAAIKGLGDSSVQHVIDAREQDGKFTSLEDLAKRLPAKVLNKKFIESLAKSGALDSVGERRTLIDNYQLIVQYRKELGDIGANQAELFAMEDTSNDAAGIEFPETPPATPQQKLQWEKETLGLYVSSHPLAGLKKYIGKKAQLIATLSSKDAGKQVKLAGLQEGIKKIRTKKGDTMAILWLEDPTGKIEVTLFPRVYNEVEAILTEPDTVLVVGGKLDMRGGQLQLRADAIKRSSLSKMIEKAQAAGFYNEEEAKKGIMPTRHQLEDEVIEAVDEEGNVIAGETLKVEEKKEEREEGFFGPLGLWIADGMNIDEPLIALELKEGKKEKPKNSTEISIHTIELPERAPKSLLLELKKTLETFSGPEKVQLKIGSQTIPLPLTITMSPVLESKIDELIKQHV